MKNLLGLVAALAITSAVSAQQTVTRTVNTFCGSRSFDQPVSASSGNGLITITNAETGAVLDTIECDRNGVSITISVTGTFTPEETAPVMPEPEVIPEVVPEPIIRPTRTRRTRTRNRVRTRSGNGGFPASAAIGLGSNAGLGGFAPGVRNAAAASLQ